MRRRGNREVNIFNIAFLDVITGALGAFVLLVILLAAQMKKAGSADPAELERLRVANRALTAMVNRLSAANAALTTQNQQLSAQNAELTAQVSRLTGENAALTKDNNRMKARADMVTVTLSNCTAGSIRTYLYAGGVSEQGTRMPAFDPAKRQDHFWVGSFHWSLAAEVAKLDVHSGADIWVYDRANETSDESYRLFYVLTTPLDPAARCAAETIIAGKTTFASTQVATLSAAKPWALAAAFTLGTDDTYKSVPSAGLTPEEQGNIQSWLNRLPQTSQ